MPFLVMLGATGIFRLSGALGTPFMDDWLIATRLGLGVMFLVTGSAHFSPRQRGDLVRMVPSWLPAPGLLLTLTGIAQIAGAVLLLWPDTSRTAAIFLMALLVLTLPDSIHAARTAHTIAGKRHLPLALRLPLQLLWIGLLWWSAGCRACVRGDAGDPSRPMLVTDDVHRFVELAAPDGVPDTTCAGLRRYLERGTPGLLGYIGRMRLDSARLCDAMRRTPERYAELADKAARFDSIADSVSAAFLRFRDLYPAARFVPAYLVVGHGVSGGTTTLGRNPVILIGAELTGKTAGLTRTIVHELMHVQQEYPAWGVMTGGPEFMRGTLLRHAIKEGAADFLMELVTGPFAGGRDAYARAHEVELWAEFQRAMHGRDYSRWLYNGWNRPAMGDRPPDLGYFMGYAITRAYYERAGDKAQAIRDILTIRDFDDFLARAGYDGRIPEPARDRFVD